MSTKPEIDEQTHRIDRYHNEGRIAEVIENIRGQNEKYAEYLGTDYSTQQALGDLALRSIQRQTRFAFVELDTLASAVPNVYNDNLGQSQLDLRQGVAELDRDKSQLIYELSDDMVKKLAESAKKIIDESDESSVTQVGKIVDTYHTSRQKRIEVISSKIEKLDKRLSTDELILELQKILNSISSGEGCVLSQAQIYGLFEMVNCQRIVLYERPSINREILFAQQLDEGGRIERIFGKRYDASLDTISQIAVFLSYRHKDETITFETLHEHLKTLVDKKTKVNSSGVSVRDLAPYALLSDSLSSIQGVESYLRSHGLKLLTGWMSRKLEDEEYVTRVYRVIDAREKNSFFVSPFSDGTITWDV